MARLSLLFLAFATLLASYSDVMALEIGVAHPHADLVARRTTSTKHHAATTTSKHHHTTTSAKHHATTTKHHTTSTNSVTWFIVNTSKHHTTTTTTKKHHTTTKKHTTTATPKKGATTTSKKAASTTLDGAARAARSPEMSQPPGTALISYEGWSYANDYDSMYTMWRNKCVHLVGPKKMHHYITVQQGEKADWAWVMCHGVPVNPKTGGYYSASDPYNRTCTLGPQTDFTLQEITKLGVQQLTGVSLYNVPGTC